MESRNNPFTTAATCRDIVSDITDGRPASDSPEAALQTVFTLLAVLPSVRLGLIDARSLTLSAEGTTFRFLALLP